MARSQFCELQWASGRNASIRLWLEEPDIEQVRAVSTYCLLINHTKGTFSAFIFNEREWLLLFLQLLFEKFNHRLVTKTEIDKYLYSGHAYMLHAFIPCTHLIIEICQQIAMYFIPQCCTVMQMASFPHNVYRTHVVMERQLQITTEQSNPTKNCQSHHQTTNWVCN